MTITVTPVDATLGAVVTDADLANLKDSTWAEIHAAFLKYGVLVFPDQNLDEQSQGAPGADQIGLADDLGQVCRSHAVGQGTAVSGAVCGVGFVEKVVVHASILTPDDGRAKVCWRESVDCRRPVG